MKRILFAAAACLLLVAPASASTATDTMKACGAAWSAMSATDKGKTTYKAFSATCLKNHGPTTTVTPAGTMAPIKPNDRMTACAAKWADLKKQGKTGGQTYAQFSAVCLKG